MNKLSIIVPCYNCADTLVEAVDSIYRQNLTIPFEVVMVDDGSSDDTKQVMEKLVERYNNIKLVFHEENRGGGAARNTAVENSSGDIIFCLDSDDIIPDTMLSKLLEVLKTKNCDGVVFQKSVFFKHKVKNIDPNSVNQQSQEYFSKTIGLVNLFNGKEGFLTQVNFLYTKEAFKRAGGYPTQHGFDTQGYGFRFLASGNKVFVCPKSFYFHRQNYKKRSYFERVYENGEFSKNMYLILEEILYRLDPKVVLEILQYDIYVNNRLGNNNLKGLLNNLQQNNVLGRDIISRSNDNSFEDFYQKYKDSSDFDKLFVCAVYEYKQGEFDLSLERYNRLKKVFDCPVVDYGISRCLLALNENYQLINIDYQAFLDLKNKWGTNKKISSRAHPLKILVLKVLKLIK